MHYTYSLHTTRSVESIYVKFQIPLIGETKFTKNPSCFYSVYKLENVTIQHPTT